LHVHTCVHILLVWRTNGTRRRTVRTFEKHGVDFADAALALEDDNALTIRDDDSDEEDRFVTIGVDGLGRLLLVAYAWRGEDIRIISARKATRRERAAYEGE